MRKLTALEVGLIVLTIGLFVGVAFIKVNLKSTKQDYSELQDILQKDREAFSLYKTVTGETVAIQSQTISSLENAIDAGLIRESDLKALNIKQLEAFTKIKQEFNMDSIMAKWNNPPTIIIRDTIVFMKLPHSFTYLDKWASIMGTVKKEGVLFDSISIVNNLTYTMGYQKSGFFKPAKPIIAIKNDNPYFITSAMSNVVVREKQPWYNRPNFYRLQGGLITFGLITGINKL